MTTDEKQAKVLDRLRGLCSRREYCSSDIYRKAFDALDRDAVKAQDIVQTLIKERYVDDLRYATAYARDKSSIAGWGEIKIRHLLSAKGISEELISEALEQTDTLQTGKRLEKLVENKYRTLKDDPQCKLKLLRFVLGRGYAYDLAKRTIERTISNEQIQKTFKG